MPALELTDSTFHSVIDNSDDYVLVDFWAPFCGHCKKLLPIVNELADELSSEVTIYTVDLTNNPQLATEFKITAIPALHLFSSGVDIQTHVGFASKTALSTWITEQIAVDKLAHVQYA
jgi:thioredoxin 1